MRISGYGDMTGTVTVQAQKATKIDILTTKIGLGNNLGSQQRIYYKVLNQYGNDMGISSNKLTINATNMSKNHTIQPTSYPNKTNTYFIVSTSQLTDAIGDKIVVVVYLQNDVSVNVSATLEIANIPATHLPLIRQILRLIVMENLLSRLDSMLQLLQLLL